MLSRVLLLVIVLAVATCPGSSAAARADGWVWPLDPLPRVVHPFEAPSSPYGPGHRGVDLAGTVGQPVLSIGAGTVSFAGSVAGRGVISIDHGALTSTYQPVTALVATGVTVDAGQPIGILQLVHSHCAPDGCLHLGVKRGARYLDPLSLLGSRPVRLKPLAGLGGDGIPGPPDQHVVQAPGDPGSRNALNTGRGATLRKDASSLRVLTNGAVVGWMAGYDGRRTLVGR